MGSVGGTDGAGARATACRVESVRIEGAACCGPGHRIVCRSGGREPLDLPGSQCHTCGRDCETASAAQQSFAGVDIALIHRRVGVVAEDIQIAKCIFVKLSIQSFDLLCNT